MCSNCILHYARIQSYIVHLQHHEYAGITAETNMIFVLALLHASVTIATEHHQGWVGVYHAAHGAVADGENTSAWDVGAWGIVAMESTPTDGGLSFAQNIDFHCRKVDVNQLFGMLIAPTEGGVFNNPNDTDILHPLPLFKRTSHGPIPGSAGPRGAAGLLQGAARWSALAKNCSQITGVRGLHVLYYYMRVRLCSPDSTAPLHYEKKNARVHIHTSTNTQVVIDDFWTNYNWDHTPTPPPGTPCPHCPANQPYAYGNSRGGGFCCTWKPANGHCRPPQGQPDIPPCCVAPGSVEGCQGERRCGTNPRTKGGG